MGFTISLRPKTLARICGEKSSLRLFKAVKVFFLAASIDDSSVRLFSDIETLTALAQRFAFFARRFA